MPPSRRRPTRLSDALDATVKRALTLFSYKSAVMDVAALASSLAEARVGQIQLAVAAKMLRTNADNAASAVKLVDAVEQNLANLAAGVGTNLDISV